MNTFFILGLPRSRTAWLANFMTHGKTFCMHEGLDGCYSMDSYIKKVRGKGDSSTGSVLLDLDKYFPDCKKVIIESDPDKAIKFSRETYGDGNEALIYRLKDRLSELNGLRVDYDDINQSLSKIWTYLSSEPYDFERGNMLKDMNVQVLDPHSYDIEAARAISHEFV